MTTNSPIVILGGAGFIGSHLIRKLSESTDTEILVLDNLHRPCEGILDQWREYQNVKFVEGDIRDKTCLSGVFRGAGMVFHLAAQSNVIGAQADLDYSFTTNVVGTYNVLQTAREQGVGRVIFTSSREVYGEPETIPVSENARLWAKNAYGSSKITGELYCQVFRQQHGLDVRILRLSNVYGPGDEDRVIPLFCRAANQGTPLTVYGGSQVIDFIWIEDVVRALLDIAELDHWDGPVNIGGGQGVSIAELAAKVKELYADPAITIDIRPAREIEVTRYIADLKKMRLMLGWVPDSPSLLHLKETASFYGRVRR
jgi:UDP-glucose 4-epimerase